MPSESVPSLSILVSKSSYGVRVFCAHPNLVGRRYLRAECRLPRVGGVRSTPYHDTTPPKHSALFLSDRSVLGQQTNFDSFRHVELTGQNLRGEFAYDAVIESPHSRYESVQRCGKLESFSNRVTCSVTMDAYVRFSNAMLKVLIVQRLE
jgi:hypothetical protein